MFFGETRGRVEGAKRESGGSFEEDISICEGCVVRIVWSLYVFLYFSREREKKRRRRGKEKGIANWGKVVIQSFDSAGKRICISTLTALCVFQH